MTRVAHPLVQTARKLGDVVRAHADEAERIRRLPAPVVEALTDAGLLRLCVPAAYDGPELPPAQLVEVIEAVAHADGAAGWCTMIASTTSSMSIFLEADVARAIYGDPSVVTGGVFAPDGEGVREGAGVRVTGRWQWGSGTQHCHWVLGGARCDDGTFRLCFAPAADVTFHDTWYTSGMRGTGSLDFSFDHVWVPDSSTIQPGVTQPQIDSPLARFPNFTLLGAGVAAVGLGIARRALDELIDLAGAKKPQYSKRTLANSSFTQVELARAEAALRSARAFLLDELEQAWALATSGEPVPDDARVRIRLAAAHAASTCASVVDTAFTLAGGTAVYDTSVLGRCLRDAHVVTQHLMTAPKLNETFGKFLLGLDVDTTMI
ncbi:MAG: acyl-CoA dehydrogenase family protein [Ilumatobacteraceae bacterium]